MNPSFGRTGDNALLLTAFALAFSPVCPLSVAAFAALRVSFPGACPGKDGSLILTKRQHPHGATLARMFSLRATLSFLRYVFAGRKRIIDDQSFIGMSDTKNINDKNGSIILIECSKRGRKID